MNVSSVSAAAVAASPDQPQSVAVARKVLDQAKQDGQQMVALIQAAAPPPGTGKLINVVG